MFYLKNGGKIQIVTNPLYKTAANYVTLLKLANSYN